VLTKGADNGNGDIFLAPQSGGQYGTGPEIVSITGQVLWFHQLPAGTFASDFRPVPLQNRRRCCDLRFGWMSWLRQDRGLCPLDCST
jgi:hypothetical protein